MNIESGKYTLLAERLLVTAHAAGREEMKIYRRDVEVEFKSDESPVTLADKAAEKIILADLRDYFSEIPVVSEEAASDGHIPEVGDRFFLVDPLDGTKEYIRKSDEFTVNIALIEQGVPVFGLVYAPALSRFYLTLDGDLAVTGEMEPDRPAPRLREIALERLVTRLPDGKGLSVVASKSHMTAETRDYLEQFEVKELRSAGSSLKFCLLARGEADLYPRFGPTMEWDTAAGHAVLQASGGRVLKEDGTELVYGKVDDNYLNPFFIAWAQSI